MQKLYNLQFLSYFERDRQVGIQVFNLEQLLYAAEHQTRNCQYVTDLELKLSSGH